MDIVKFKTEFQSILVKAIESKFEEYTTYTQDTEILEIINYAKSIIGGGKCIRPYMAYTLYETLGSGDKDTIMDLLVSLEIFHAFALIHDDVIDEGKIRHKVDTMHTFVSKSIKENHRIFANRGHYGHSQAILVGDLLFSWSISRFHQFNHLPYYSEACKVFCTMIDEVAIGQMIDVNVMTRDEISSKLIETKMRLKTAGYTFVRPMQIGVALAGKEKELTKFCSDFGIALGLAFQTQDDILDIIADPKIIKKSILSEIREHQHTFLTQYVLENASDEDILELEKYWGNPEINDNAQDDIINLFKRTGALSYARGKIKEYLDQAKQIIIEESEITDKTRLALNQLIKYIEDRGY
ncbi:MAG: polyprenyl synthetase family protein [Candidatus Paceibacterota bacterium]